MSRTPADDYLPGTSTMPLAEVRPDETTPLNGSPGSTVKLPTDFYIVQHGEKVKTPGDPPLSGLGVRQARLTGCHLRGRGIVRLYSSPQQRARQTADLIAAQLGVTVWSDARLRERMNWGDAPRPQTAAQFLAEWARATHDRDFVPLSGHSSRTAGQRGASLLEELAETHSGEAVGLVAHGGVTVDLLRNLFGDSYLAVIAPTLIEAGIPGCGITHLRWREGKYMALTIAAVTHLAVEQTEHGPA